MAWPVLTAPHAFEIRMFPDRISEATKSSAQVRASASCGTDAEIIG
jgi:hypothetical protein